MKVIVDDENIYDVRIKECPGDSSNFLVVQEELDNRGLLKKAKIGQADCLMAKGSDILNVSLGLMKKDPAVLLCHKDRCTVCTGRRRFLAEHKDDM